MEEAETQSWISKVWVRIKMWVFMKLGDDLWQYIVVHEDYFKRPYGISYTHRRDFIKLIKEDIKDMDDDLEEEIKKG